MLGVVPTPSTSCLASRAIFTCLPFPSKRWINASDEVFSVATQFPLISALTLFEILVLHATVRFEVNEVITASFVPPTRDVPATWRLPLAESQVRRAPFPLLLMRFETLPLATVIVRMIPSLLPTTFRWAIV